MMYECAICNHVNHSARLHCSACGAVPANYSWSHETYVPPDSNIIPPMSVLVTYRSIVAAHGCERAERNKYTKVRLKTVALDYYAD